MIMIIKRQVPGTLHTAVQRVKLEQSGATLKRMIYHAIWAWVPRRGLPGSCQLLPAPDDASGRLRRLLRSCAGEVAGTEPTVVKSPWRRRERTLYKTTTGASAERAARSEFARLRRRVALLRLAVRACPIDGLEVEALDRVLEVAEVVQSAGEHVVAKQPLELHRHVTSDFRRVAQHLEFLLAQECGVVVHIQA
jgi:hypothetical protein